MGAAHINSVAAGPRPAQYGTTVSGHMLENARRRAANCIHDREPMIVVAPARPGGFGWAERDVWVWREPAALISLHAAQNMGLFSI